jgi:hypothetical protein
VPPTLSKKRAISIAMEEVGKSTSGVEINARTGMVNGHMMTVN